MTLEFQDSAMGIFHPILSWSKTLAFGNLICQKEEMNK